MAEKIFLIQPDDSLVTVDESPFENEDVFQALLARHPGLLSGHQVRPEKTIRWLLVSREVGVPDSGEGCARWSLDHLYLDQDGVPTLVEVKRSSDTRIRREVVGQMLDYAANAIVYWPPNEIQHQFELRCEEEGIDPDAELVQFLIDSDLEANEFWDRVKTNLQARKIRMLFVTEAMPRELKRIIEFLNEQMDPAEVLGLELRHHSGGGARVLVPQVVGRTETAASRKGNEARPPKHWNRERILEATNEKRGSFIRDQLDELLTATEPLADQLEYGKGAVYGRCSPIITRTEAGKSVKYRFFNVWVPETNFVIDMGELKSHEGFTNKEAAAALDQVVREIPGIQIMGTGNWAELRIKDDDAQAKLKGLQEFAAWLSRKLKRL